MIAYPALCIIAVGSSCWTLFSLAPTFLLYSDKRQMLMLNLIVHGLLLSGLTALLFAYRGVMGAAVAYAVAIGALSISNLLLALRVYRQFRSQSEAEN